MGSDKNQTITSLCRLFTNTLVGFAHISVNVRCSHVSRNKRFLYPNLSETAQRNTRDVMTACMHMHYYYGLIKAVYIVRQTCPAYL